MPRTPVRRDIHKTLFSPSPAIASISKTLAIAETVIELPRAFARVIDALTLSMKTLAKKKNASKTFTQNSETALPQP